MCTKLMWNSIITVSKIAILNLLETPSFLCCVRKVADTKKDLFIYFTFKWERNILEKISVLAIHELPKVRTSLDKCVGITGSKC